MGGLQPLGGTTPLITAGESAGESSASDRVGTIEKAGIDYLPEEARESSPRNLFAVFVGGNLAFSTIIFGWLPITLGLNFWQAISSNAVGLVIGLVLTAPMTLLGPRTGTNNPVSSGAHFGVRGRLIGSTLTLMFALAYAAIAVWTSGEALVAGAGRLFGAPQNQLAFILGYGIIALEVVLIALYGHATIVWAQKVIIPVAVVVLTLGVLAYAPNFHPTGGGGGHVAGGSWPTWLFAVTVSVGGPLSYAPSVGDYTRRISRRKYSDRQIAFAVSAGIFLGLFSTAAFGAFTASTFLAPTASYVADMVANAPDWYIFPLLILAVLGGCGQGVISIYSSGLDLESILPRLNRTQTTLIASGIAVVLMYLGVVATNAIDSITGMTVVLNAFAGSWVAINICGFFANRGHYDPIALQRFGPDGRGGPYWFWGGFNLRAVVPFIAGSGLGLLTVVNDLYEAPFADLAGGIDISLLLSVVVSGGLYWFSLVLWPPRGFLCVPVDEHRGPKSCSIRMGDEPAR